MANPELFESAGKRPAPSDAVNEAGGAAYRMSPRHALAQLAATGTLGQTFYADGRQQLDSVLAAARACPLDYVAKVAVYSRRRGLMKDMPALLVAHGLATAKDDADRAVVSAAFRAVVDNGRMLRNVVQIVRSGTLGRKSLGSWPKRLVREWLDRQTPEYLVRQSVGNDPSLSDVIAMARPKPTSARRRATYAWIRQQHMGAHEKRPIDADELPPLVRAFESFRDSADRSALSPPAVPFQMLDALGLTREHWAEVFRTGGWMFTRMNLNTALRQGVFDVDGMVDLIAARLADAEELRDARQFPYQLFAAYKHVAEGMPRKVVDALHSAMENACANVPEFEGRVAIAVDSSGSMGSAVTASHGHRTASKMSCADVAGLFAAAVVRRNPDALVIRFDTDAEVVRIEPRDTVATIAGRLNRSGGGTACSTPIRLLNRERRDVDLLVFVSDNQSWYDRGGWLHGHAGPTATAREWAELKKRCPRARQVRIDVQPYGTSQMPEDRADTLMVGGFSDSVFDVIAAYSRGSEPGFWVSEIEKLDLAEPGRAAT